jgi:hypothetical protein
MAEDNTAVCCFCIKIDIAIKIMLVLTILSFIGSILNIVNTLSFLDSGIGGIVLLIIIAAGQAAAVFCYYKFIMVFYGHVKKEGDHDDAERQSLVDAFKWLAYGYAAMYASAAIAYIVYSIIWGKGDMGISYGIRMLVSNLISALISFAILYWWRLSFQQHVNNNNGGGPVDTNPMGAIAAAKEMAATAKADAGEAKEAAVAAPAAAAE